MRAFKIYSISNFKICNTVLLTIVILPYIPPPQYLFYILEFVPFDSIHLFHFHPSSLPLATTNLFYLWAWLKKYIYILHMEWSIYMVFVFVWPTSLSIMPSRSIHIVANDNVLLFLKAELSYNWILKCSVILSNLGASSFFLWFFKAPFNTVETLIFSEVTSTLSHTLLHKLFLHKVFLKCLMSSYVTDIVPTLLRC